ncbi:hypothetical protein JKP88DRAFT_323661 [Tribonema minus]|uniref:Uncharacterized protein n=1 Tax=Tribonema minus TaxID=303371 RepID=A0A836CD07_9STRA|nr:hypothetical protein JKP88DRAFT_323661 [Tribonema minus]
MATSEEAVYSFTDADMWKCSVWETDLEEAHITSRTMMGSLKRVTPTMVDDKQVAELLQNTYHEAGMSAVLEMCKSDKDMLAVSAKEPGCIDTSDPYVAKATAEYNKYAERYSDMTDFLVRGSGYQCETCQVALSSRKMPHNKRTTCPCCGYRKDIRAQLCKPCNNRSSASIEKLRPGDRARRTLVRRYGEATNQAWRLTQLIAGLRQAATLKPFRGGLVRFPACFEHPGLYRVAHRGQDSDGWVVYAGRFTKVEDVKSRLTLRTNQLSGVETLMVTLRDLDKGEDLDIADIPLVPHISWLNTRISSC